MPKLTIGRISFRVKQPTATVALQAYGKRAIAGVPAVMAESQARVYGQTLAGTPEASGYMRSTLRREMDEDGFSYAVGWSPQDYPGGGKRYVYNTSAMNPASQGVPVVTAGFYPGFVIFGTRYMASRDPLTPALEAERPLLLRDLANLFQRSAK